MNEPRSPPIPAAIVIGFLLVLAMALAAAPIGHGGFIVMRQRSF
jgi:hypothetical protein